MKVLSVILTVALVLSYAFPAYATSTGSALTFDDQWLFEAAGIKPIEQASIEAAEIKAASSPDGSQAHPYYSIAQTEGTWLPWTIDTDNKDDIGSIQSVLSFTQLFQAFYDGLLDSLRNQMDYLFYHQVDLGDGTYSESGLIMMERNLLGSYVALLEMQPVLSTISTRANTTNTRLNTVNTNLTSIITDILAGNTAFSNEFTWDFSGTYGLPRYRQLSNGGSSQDLTPTISAHNLLNTIFYLLNNINASMVYAARDTLSGVASSVKGTYLDKDLVSQSLGRQSLWYDIRALGTNINDIVARLGYVLASDDEIEARAQAANNQAAIVEDFVDPSGAGSISVSDIGDMAGLSESMKDTFSSNVDPSLIFDGVGSESHAWDWFTNDVKNSLAYNPSRGSDQLRSSPAADSSTPYLDAYYRDVQETLGISLW